MSKTLLKSVVAPPTAFENDVCEQRASTKSRQDFSFEIWREIFKFIAANEKNALETCQTVQFTLEVTQCCARVRTPVVNIELICEPGQPAKAVSGLPRCDDSSSEPR